MDRQTDVDGMSLIDVSAEDDSLLSSPALKLSNDADRTPDFRSSPAITFRVQRNALSSTHHCTSWSESTERGGANEKHSALHDGLNCVADKQDNGTSSAMVGEQPLLSKEPVQPTRKRRAGQCNLRKSLAWDKAFFTSEGVLNPEELSLVNKTFKKSNETLLPVIEEEESVRSSFGSNCSLGEDDSALHCLEEKLFTELQTSKPKHDNEVDKIYNAASCETFPAQTLELPQSIAKHVAPEKRHIATKVVETPLQKKAALGPHTSFTSKRPSVKATEELQKAIQSNDARGKNCSAVPPVVTKNLSKGHKRMKDTHGNAVPATLTRASYHRNSPAKIKEIFVITGRSFPSPNSSGSDKLNSEKCPASSSCTLEKLRKSLFEMPKEVAHGTPDSARSGNLLGTSCSQFLHGIPACHSSMVSAALTGNSSVFLTHTSREQFAPSAGAGTSADSIVSQCAKNREFKNTMAGYLSTKDDSISIACNSMIFSAKDPPSNSGNALPETFTAKSSGLRMPTKDDSISGASNSMVFSAKDPPRNPGNALPITFAAKPSGLRMPSPKLGFFDSTKVIRAEESEMSEGVQRTTVRGT